MTTIAFDGSCMSSDSRATHGDAGSMKCTKLFRVMVRPTPRAKPREHILGICGDLFSATVFVNAYRDGKLKADLFQYMHHEDEDFGVLVWTGRKLYEVNRHCAFIEVEDKMHAIGSGAAFALGAMASGKNSAEAVRIACKFDGYSGLPVVSMRLKDKTTDSGSL